MRLHRPEQSCERDLLRRRKVLIAEDQHEMLVQRVADRAAGGLVDRTRKVDTADLHGQRAAQPLDRHRTRMSSTPVPSIIATSLAVRSGTL